MANSDPKYWTVSYKASVSAGAFKVGVEVGELHVKNVSTGEVGVFVFVGGELGPSMSPLTLARFADSPTLIETSNRITLEDFAGHTEVFSLQGGVGPGWSFSAIQFRDIEIGRQWGTKTIPGQPTEIDEQKFADDDRSTHAIDVSGPMMSTPTASATACRGFSKLVATYREAPEPQLGAGATTARAITNEEINAVGQEILGDAWIDVATRTEMELEAMLVEAGLQEALDALDHREVTGADHVVRSLREQLGTEPSERSDQSPTPRVQAFPPLDPDSDVLVDDGFGPDPSHDLAFIPGPTHGPTAPPAVHLTGLPDGTSALIQPNPPSTFSDTPGVDALSGLPDSTNHLLSGAVGGSTTAPTEVSGAQAGAPSIPDPGSVEMLPPEPGHLSGLPGAAISGLDPDPGSALVEPSDADHLTGLPDATLDLIQQGSPDDSSPEAADADHVNPANEPLAPIDPRPPGPG